MSDRLDLGIGIVAFDGLDLLWPSIADLVEVVEVEPQRSADVVTAGWKPNPGSNAWIKNIDRPILAHGAGFPVGGQVEPDPRGVSLFAECCRELQVVHASEHVSFNRVVSGDAFLHSGFPLPPRQSWETVDAAVEHITRYQGLLDSPFLLECGVSYLRPDCDELDDGTFLAEIVERADCGLLLDLHDLLTNERNGRYPVEQVLRRLPLERVQEIHVAGGFELDGYWLDAHSGPCDQTLLALLATTLPQLPNVRAVIFEALPAYMTSMGAAGVRRQLDLIHDVVHGAARRPVRRQPRRPNTNKGLGVSEMSEAEWQRKVIEYATRRCDTPPSGDPGFAVLRELTDQARLGRIAVDARAAVTALRTRLGDPAVEQLAMEYLDQFDEEMWPSAEASAFHRWVTDRRQLVGAGSPSGRSHEADRRANSYWPSGLVGGVVGSVDGVSSPGSTPVSAASSSLTSRTIKSSSASSS